MGVVLSYFNNILWITEEPYSHLIARTSEIQTHTHERSVVKWECHLFLTVSLSPSGLGWGMALMIFSIWLIVDVPGNRALPSSISPKMQPRLHMSTPLVYLRTWGPYSQWTLSNPSQATSAQTGKCWRYLADPSRISGARYQRVATYSVSAGLQLSSWNCFSDLARPKSHSLTTQSVSNSTLEGCGGNKRAKAWVSQTLPFNSKTADVPFRPCGWHFQNAGI